MLTKKEKKKIIISSIIAIAIIASMAMSAYAADTANISISVDGNITEYTAKIIGLLKEPVEVALQYLTSFLQYFAGWLATI